MLCNSNCIVLHCGSLLSSLSPWISSGKNKISWWKYYSSSKADKLNNGPRHTALTALYKDTTYLWLSLKASFPFLQEIIPRGDIRGLHSIRTSPPCRASVWALSKFWEKSGAIADERKERDGSILREGEEDEKNRWGLINCRRKEMRATQEMRAEEHPKNTQVAPSIR